MFFLDIELFSPGQSMSPHIASDISISFNAECLDMNWAFKGTMSRVMFKYRQVAEWFHLFPDSQNTKTGICKLFTGEVNTNGE